MLAIAALVDIADQAELAPVVGTIELRALLATTWVLAGADQSKRWLFDQFWAAVTHKQGPKTTVFLDGYARAMNATTAVRGIQHCLGLPPDVTFDHEVKAMVKRMRAQRR